MAEREAQRFADPYKRCNRCGQWITGYRPRHFGPDRLTPCGHDGGYRNLCPSWGPVDGCQCRRIFGIQEHGRPDGPFPPGVVP